MITVRLAKPEDAAGIKRVQKATWLATYPSPENGISYEDIEQKTAEWDSAEAIEDLRLRINNLPKNYMRLVAVENDQIVGNSMFEKHEAVNRLGALYVLPDYQGQGIGHKLASKGLRWLGNKKNVELEVASYNFHAINFYRKLGFEVMGKANNKVAELPSGAKIPELKMIKIM